MHSAMVSALVKMIEKKSLELKPGKTVR